MSMFKVLSIDWDFFINAPITLRDKLFPQDNEYSDEETQKENWDKAYLDSAFESKRLTSIMPYSAYYKDYYTALTSYLKTGNLLVVAKSHKDIYDSILSSIPQHTREVSVLNLDFHHDMYHLVSSGDEVNCGNWARKMFEHFADTNIRFSYKWVGWQCSDHKVITGEVIPMYPYRNAKNAIKNIDDFDMVFVCRSDPWSPPHLDHYFNLPFKGTEFCLPEREYPVMPRTIDINPGDLFEHFKGSLIEVIDTCQHSETEELMVCYRHLDDGAVWVRPLEMFCQETYDPFGQKVKRFKKLGDDCADKNVCS